MLPREIFAESTLQRVCGVARRSKCSLSLVRIPLIPCIPSALLRTLVTRALSGLAVTLLVVSVAGVVPLERRRRRWEREEEEERQERDRALNELFHGADLWDEPDPEEDDDVGWQDLRVEVSVGWL